MKVVVTGGSGFIGANLVREFLTAGDMVTVLDDFSTGERVNLDGCDAAIVEGSVLDAVALDEAFDGAEAVVHLAARPSVPRSLADPLASHHANATGTLQVLEAARRASGPHVVVASSSSV
jgi:UDP-glucose 4-epimerase